MVSGCSSSRETITSQRQQVKPNVTEQPTGSENAYRIRPGDEMEILVWEQPSFNTLTVVSSSGTIAIPLIGELQVTGLTKEELSRDLKRKLSEYIRGDINLTISIRNIDNMMVSVLGMISKPDNYPVVDQVSIFRVLATAGGPTENANLNKVKLYRREGPENYLTLNLVDYLESGQMNSPIIVVRPGDIIFVPEQENVVREMSEFLRDVIILFGIFRIFN